MCVPMYILKIFLVTNKSIIYLHSFYCSVVDGGWSSWTEGSCTKNCGGGTKQFTRSCNNPTPSCGGLSCIGNSTYEEECNKFCCRGKVITCLHNWLQWI